MSPSPRIQTLRWGHVEAESLGVQRDVKLWPGGGRAWDWRETGTRHVPGVQLADLTELLQHGAEIVVLSRGMDLVLQVPAETLDALRQLGVAVHVLETREAAKLYNTLAEAGQRVGGVFHSTC